MLYETDREVNDQSPGNAQQREAPRVFLPVHPIFPNQMPDVILEWIRAKAPEHDGRLYFRISEVYRVFKAPKMFYHVVTALYRQGMAEVERWRLQRLGESKKESRLTPSGKPLQWYETELIYVLKPIDISHPIAFECYAPQITPEQTFSKEERLAIWQRFNGACFYCDEPVALEDMSIDHGTPRSRGGGHDPDNLFCACRSCNNVKRAQTTEEYLRSLGRELS